MSTKKKLAIVVANYFEQCSGGAELQAYYLARNAKEKGWKVYYIFISNGKDYKNSLNIHLIPVKKNTIMTKAGNVKLIGAIAAWKHLKKIKPDAIYQRCASSFTAVSALYARLHRINSTYHIASDSDLISRKTLSPLVFLETILTSYGQKHSKTIIAQTSFQATKYRHKFSRNVNAIVSNGHPVPNNPSPKGAAIKIVWIANMKPQKQPELFIKLAQELKQNNEVSCIMIGRIDNYSKIIGNAESKGIIKALGELSNDEVNQFLEQSHILINTSKFEGFSNTFIQAWMRRTPVISLNVDPDNIITTQKIGYVSQNFKNMVVDTKRLINNLAELELMGQKARHYAITNHSINNISKLIDNTDTSHQ